jgi:hypothetical protein
MSMHPEVARSPVYKSISESGKVIYSTSTPFGIGKVSVVQRSESDWDLGLISVRGEGHKGIGTHVVNAFVADVGPGCIVQGSIIHEESMKILSRLGYPKMELGRGEVTISDERKIEVPIIRLLIQGGINVDHAFIGYLTNRGWPYVPYDFSYIGTTMFTPRTFEIVDQTIR